MPTTRSWAGVAGLCALALAATTLGKHLQALLERSEA